MLHATTINNRLEKYIQHYSHNYVTKVQSRPKPKNAIIYSVASAICNILYTYCWILHSFEIILVYDKQIVGCFIKMQDPPRYIQ